jgi:hypothetical protein
MRKVQLIAFAVLLLLNFAVKNPAQSKLSDSLQTAPRRAKIRFPDDCNFYAAASENDLKLENGCAAALDKVLPALPREDCDYGEFLRQNDYSEFLEYLDDYQSRAVRFYPLAPNKYLVEVPCSVAAYNVSNVYLLYDESRLPAKAEVLEFPGFKFTYDEDRDSVEKIENITAKTVGGRGFNLKTKELIVFEKARGIGDAGRYARYSFFGGKPKLVEYRAKFSWTGRAYSTDEILKRPPLAWKRYFPK